MFYYVYVLQSERNCQKYYTGYTTDLKERLRVHNTRHNCQYTEEFQPWRLVWSMAVRDIDIAKKYEVYLKSPSGRAYARKRFGLRDYT